MSTKYAPLTDYLAARQGRPITMTFGDVERVVGRPLPASKHYRAWWSNNPTNNVMTRAWLAAGFKTANVDITAERLTFMPAEPGTPSNAPGGRPEGGSSGRHPAWGSLRNTVTWTVDLTLPVEAEWEADRDGPAA